MRVCEPDVAFVPLQPFEAVQLVALVLDHVSVELPPELTVVGLAEIVTVGATAPACIVALAVLELAETLPAASMALTVYEYAVEAESPVSE